MRFEDLNWMDIENYLKTDDRIMVVLGSCEQHGYLSQTTDTKIPMALADAASRQTNVLIAPSVSFGISQYFMEYPGTISIKTETYLALVSQIIESLYKHGFKRILVLNGHGGNEPARMALGELINQYSDLQTNWYSWWTSSSFEAVARKYSLRGYHASWSENFSFTRTTEVPDGIKEVPAFKGLKNAKEVKEIYGDGVFGGQYQVSEEIMQEIFNACLKDILFYLQF